MPVHPANCGEAEAVVMGANKNARPGPSGIAAVVPVSEHCVERIQAIHQQGDANPRYYLDMMAALKKGDDDQTAVDAGHQPRHGLGCRPGRC